VDLRPLLLEFKFLWPENYNFSVKPYLLLRICFVGAKFRENACMAELPPRPPPKKRMGPPTAASAKSDVFQAQKAHSFFLLVKNAETAPWYLSFSGWQGPAEKSRRALAVHRNNGF
jgi:hypothetical protein